MASAKSPSLTVRVIESQARSHPGARSRPAAISSSVSSLIAPCSHQFAPCTGRPASRRNPPAIGWATAGPPTADLPAVRGDSDARFAAVDAASYPAGRRPPGTWRGHDRLRGLADAAALPQRDRRAQRGQKRRRPVRPVAYGELFVSGDGAAEALDYALVGAASAIQP